MYIAEWKKILLATGILAVILVLVAHYQSAVKSSDTPFPEELKRYPFKLAYDSPNGPKVLDLAALTVQPAESTEEIITKPVNRPSPDGEHFIREGGDFIAVVAAQTSQEYPIRPAVDFVKTWNAKWSPDGKSVVFFKQPQDTNTWGTRVVDVVSIDEILSQKYNNPHVILMTGDDFEWLDNDSVVVWGLGPDHSGCGGEGYITTYNKTTKQFNHPLVAGKGGVYNFSLSPDRSLVVYQRGKFDNDGWWIGDEIVIAKADGTELYSFEGQNPSWSGKVYRYNFMTTRPWNPNCLLPDSRLFTDPQITDEWLTYFNTAYNYSFKYPPSHFFVSNTGPNSAGPEKSNSIMLAGVKSLGRLGTFKVEMRMPTSDARVPQAIAEVLALPLREYAYHIWQNNNEDSNPHIPNKHVSNIEEFNLNGYPAYKFTLSGSYQGDDVMGGYTLEEEFTFVITGTDTTKYQISFPSRVRLWHAVLSSFEISEVAETSDWQTYLNKEYGFSFQYPSDWLLKYPAHVNPSDGMIVYLQSPEFLRMLESGAYYEGPDSNLTISFWKDVNNEFTKGGSWMGQKIYASLLEMISDKAGFKRKTGETFIDDRLAYEVIIGGIGVNYGLMIETDKGIYELSFNAAANKYQLSSIERLLLSTFKFLNN